MHKKTMICRFSLALLSLMVMFFTAPSGAQNQPIMITVTKGFGLSLYASDLGDAKQMAFGDKGTLFVGSHKSGTIQALVDANADGRVDKRYVIAKGLEYPEALAFHDGDLYVAEEDRIIPSPLHLSLALPPLGRCGQRQQDNQ